MVATVGAGWCEAWVNGGGIEGGGESEPVQHDREGRNERSAERVRDFRGRLRVSGRRG